MGCGLGAVKAYDDNVDVPFLLYTLAQSQNNRGDETTGFGFYTGSSIGFESSSDEVYREARNGLGLIKYDGGVGPEIYPQVKQEFADAEVGIVHDRYATSGRSDLAHAQPFIIDGEQTLLLGHNGNIANHEELRDATEFEYETGSDTEVIGRILADHHDVTDGLRELEEQAQGAFNLTILDEDGTLYAYRDSMGQHPLHYSTKEQDGVIASAIVASEDFALNAAGYHEIIEVNPGELVTITEDVESEQLVKPNKQFCPFEIYYFENPGSSYRDRRIQDIRWDIGYYEGLSEPLKKNDDAVVIPVMASGGAFADGYAEAAGLSAPEWLVRNRESRNYMIPEERDPDQVMTREQHAALKHVPLSELAGKKAVFVDDSVVRGSTSTAITRAAYDAGAEEVHWRVMFPKITDPCFYGLDHSERDNLIAVADDGSVRSDNEIATVIGADTVRYGSRDTFEQVTGDTNNCWACVTGNYPTEIPNNE